MLPIIVFAAVLAADSGLTAEQARDIGRAGLIDLEADSIRANQEARIVVLSALLCDAWDRRRSSEGVLLARPSRPAARAYVKAVHDVDDIETAFGVLGREPLDCSSHDVGHLTACLGAPAPRYCEMEPEMPAKVQAATATMGSLPRGGR